MESQVQDMVPPVLVMEFQAQAMVCLVMKHLVMKHPAQDMELHLVLVEEPSERIRTRIRIRIRVVTATVLPAANMQLLATTIGERSTYSVYFRRAVKKRRKSR